MYSYEEEQIEKLQEEIDTLTDQRDRFFRCLRGIAIAIDLGEVTGINKEVITRLTDSICCPYKGHHQPCDCKGMGGDR